MAPGALIPLAAYMSARRLALLFALCLATTGITGTALAAPATPAGAAVAKKKPKCKAGFNKKSCRCPKGQSLKKNRKGYRCAKKPAAAAPDTADTAPATGTAPVTDPAPPEKVRNDQALIDALSNAAFYKTYSGGGFGSYAYNFLPTVLGEVDGRKLFSLRYCTYYYAVGFTTDRSNYDGAWVVKEGYTDPAEPGLITGVLQLWRQGMPEDKVVEAPVAVKGDSAAIKTGDGSSFFEPGEYQFKPGRATTDCATWEPA